MYGIRQKKIFESNLDHGDGNEEEIVGLVM